MVIHMIIGIKDAVKLTGVMLIVFCAILVCTMFMNFYIDILGIENQLVSEQETIFYHAQISTAKVVCAVSGGCLLITSVIMLLFYIKHYIDTHKKELGILKALGYSEFKVAKNFWVFGGSVFSGAILGFAGAFFLMPAFYSIQNKDKILPEIPIAFHFSLFGYLVMIPTVVFAGFSVVYAWYKLKTPVIYLLKETEKGSVKQKKRKDGDKNRPFLEELRKNTLKEKKTHVFFVIFSSFCFSSMTQMSMSMKDLSSIMMGIMILLIGMVLSCTTLFLATATVIHGQTKTIAMMKVFGYSQKECCGAILGGYRPMAYIGFVLGTGYQYALLRIMVDLVFKDVSEVPVYEFDLPGMLMSLAAFIIVYEFTMYLYTEKIKKVPIKEIMLET